ncbi:hypothetical protein C8J57DRAFT_1006644, partial [Mycena rebaudengoi]
PQRDSYLDHTLSPQSDSLQYTDFSQSIHHRLALPGSDDTLDLLLDRVVQPYDATEFERLLAKHNLSSSYPYLVQNLRGGFPL